MASRLLVLPILVALVIAGCAPSLYVPSSSDTSADASLADLRTGRELYARRCGSCHTLPLPERFTQEEWRQHLDEMRQRARLTDQDIDVILKFLAAGIRRANVVPS